MVLAVVASIMVHENIRMIEVAKSGLFAGVVIAGVIVKHVNFKPWQAASAVGRITESTSTGWDPYLATYTRSMNKDMYEFSLFLLVAY